MAVAHVSFLQNLWLENTSNEQILGVAVGSNLEQKSVSEKQSHSGSCWEKFKTTRKIYIYTPAIAIVYFLDFYTRGIYI